MVDEINFYHPDETVILFPDREVLPFDHFSPHEDLTSDRLSALCKITHLNSGTIVIAVNTLMSKLPPKKHCIASNLSIECGKKITIEDFRKKLIMLGYQNNQQVWRHGEFSLRGSILDVFPMGENKPIRIEWFDDTIETIRVFDNDTQRSLHKIEQFQCLPAHEYALNDESIAVFRQQWRENFAEIKQESPVYTAVSHGELISGLETYLPLFGSYLVLI